LLPSRAVGAAPLAVAPLVALAFFGATGAALGATLGSGLGATADDPNRVRQGWQASFEGGYDGFTDQLQFVGNRDVVNPLNILAALGGEIEIPTPDGFAKIKLPPGTPNGKVFRLRDKGMPNLEGHGHGDLHVRVVLEVPTRISGKQRKLLEDFAAATDASNYPDAARIHNTAEEFFARRDVLRQTTKK
jgi:hypothetical protein